MTRSGLPCLPYLRSIVLVSLVLSVSSASHVLAAGHLPHLGVMLLLGVLLLAPMVLLGRRRVTFRSAVALMGAGQVALHSLFELTAVPAVCQSSSAMPGHHAAFELACSPVAQEPMGAATSGLMMVLLHTLATLLLAAMVAKSEEAGALLRAWLAPLVSLPVAVTLPASPRRTAVAVPAPAAPLSVHAVVPTLRGPPQHLLLPA